MQREGEKKKNNKNNSPENTITKKKILFKSLESSLKYRNDKYCCL